MQIGPRIRFDRHTLGNLVKNVAPVAGTLLGGPAGFALSGLMGAGGELARGGNAGSAFKSGLSNASLAGLGSAAKSGLSGLLNHGGAEVAQVAQAGAPELAGSSALDALPTAIPSVGTIGDGAAAAAPLNPIAAAATSATKSAPSFLSRAGSFIEKHPTAVGMGLKGLGEVATAPSESRYRNAQTHALEVQTQADEDERRRRLAMQTALGPLAQQLVGQFGQSRPIAPNPYAPPMAPMGGA